MSRMRAIIRMAGLAVVLTACPAAPVPTPDLPVSPGTVGQIVDSDHDNAADRYTLDLGGSIVELERDAVAIYGRPVLGGLLLVGEADGQRWYAVLPHRDAEGCFALANGSAINEGSTVLFPVEGEYGLRLQKATEWQEPPYESDGDRYPIWLGDWCINAEGQVISVEETAAG